MNKSMVTRFLLLSAFIVIFGSCAKISAPTGGSRDRQPPIVLESVPELGAKNFKDKKLIITLDEYVVLDNINEKFLVSPPLKKKPRVSMKSKNVIVEFEENLKDSTTYTFYFQDAIRDLNEGNVLDNYQFVISTGPYVDSLSVTGNVYNSFNLEVPEKAVVLLHRELADSNVVKHVPDYISRVNLDGYFRINNISAGIYRLYALVDADNSMNYNVPEEEFAFMSDSIEVTPENNFIPVVKDSVIIEKNPVVKAINTVSGKKEDIVEEEVIVPQGEYALMLFAAKRKNHYLTSSDRPLKYEMMYTLSLPPDSMEFKFSIPETEESAYFIERSRDRDTIKIWLTDSTLFSQNMITTIVNYPFTDSLGMVDYKEDTILMRFIPPRVTRGVKLKIPVLGISTNIQSGKLKPGTQISISSETPLIQPDTSRIHIYQELDSSRISLPYVLIKDSTKSTRYFINTDLAQGNKYLFIADSASFGNLFNEYSDSIGLKFSIREENTYSKLIMKIQNYEGDRIIQLLDSKEKLVSEKIMKEDGEITFPLLEPGIYRVRCIYDINGDGKWTTGDFTTDRQPEPVSYYPDQLEIKAGIWFEIEQDWDISVQFVKEQKLRERKSSKK